MLVELKELLQSLQSENKWLQQQVGSTGANVGVDPSASSTSPAFTSITEHVIFVPRDRRCHAFSDQGDKDVFVWIEEVKASLRALFNNTRIPLLWMFRRRLDGGSCHVMRKSTNFPSRQNYEVEKL